MVCIYPNSSLSTSELLTFKAVKMGFSAKKKKKAVGDTCILVAEMEISEYTHGCISTLSFGNTMLLAVIPK